jgi:hypothetical protein
MSQLYLNLHLFINLNIFRYMHILIKLRHPYVDEEYTSSFQQLNARKKCKMGRQAVQLSPPCTSLLVHQYRISSSYVFLVLKSCVCMWVMNRSTRKLFCITPTQINNPNCHPKRALQIAILERWPNIYGSKYGRWCGYLTCFKNIILSTYDPVLLYSVRVCHIQL